MGNDGRARSGQQSNGDDVEARLVADVVCPDKGVGSAANTVTLTCTDHFDGIDRMVVAGLDLGENYKRAGECNDIDLGSCRPVVSGENGISASNEIVARYLLAKVSDIVVGRHERWCGIPDAG